jgi:serine/threonine-protein kinase BUR1
MFILSCVLGEMFLRHPILPGNSDLDQLEKIWQMCGTPNQHTWPNFDTLPGCEGVKHHNQHPKRLKSVFEQSVIARSVVGLFG